MNEVGTRRSNFWQQWTGRGCVGLIRKNINMPIISKSTKKKPFSPSHFIMPVERIWGAQYSVWWRKKTRHLSMNFKCLVFSQLFYRGARIFWTSVYIGVDLAGVLDLHFMILLKTAIIIWENLLRTIGISKQYFNVKFLDLIPIHTGIRDFWKDGRE